MMCGKGVVKKLLRVCQKNVKNTNKLYITDQFLNNSLRGLIE